MENGSLRRKLGIVCLAVPGGMVILGQTVLKPSLDGWAFLVYWFICFVFTFIAIFIALVDLRAVRRETRDATQGLVEHALEEIERTVNEKPAKSAHRPDSA